MLCGKDDSKDDKDSSQAHRNEVAMNIRLERKDEAPTPTNISCPWDSCVSNLRGWCHGTVKLVSADVSQYSKDDGEITYERLVCANFEGRKHDTR